MSSVALVLSNGQTIDLSLETTGVASDKTLETSVLLSLFSDRRAMDDELILGNTDKKGWWGDMYADVDKDQIGSKLWLLAREKMLPATLVKAEEYAKESLQWMIDDGVASSIEVTASFVEKMLFLEVIITRFNGANQKYAVRWTEEGVRRI